MAKRKNEEEQYQAQIVSWTRKNDIPLIASDYWKILNRELNRMDERRVWAIYGKMREQGWNKSDPDFHIPVPKRGYGSLFIELKTPKTYPFRKNKDGKYWIEYTKDECTKNYMFSQIARLGQFAKYGNFCCVCQDADMAQLVIRWYMEHEFDEQTEYIEFEKFKFHYGRYVPEELSIDVFKNYRS